MEEKSEEEVSVEPQVLVVVAGSIPTGPITGEPTTFRVLSEILNAVWPMKKARADPDMIAQRSESLSLAGTRNGSET